MLDAGADGFILSTINEAAELDWATQITRYPPEGERGMGLHAANMYGLHFDDYLIQQRTHPIIIAQIENAKGIKNLDQIVNHASVDAIFVGPYDLSLSLGVPGNFKSAVFEDALGTIRETAARANVPVGIHCIDNNIDSFKQLLLDQYQLIACSLDTKIILASALSFRSTVNNFESH